MTGLLRTTSSMALGLLLLGTTDTRRLLPRFLLGSVIAAVVDSTRTRSAHSRRTRCFSLALLLLLLLRLVVQIVKLTHAQILHVAIFVFAPAVLFVSRTQTDLHDRALEPAMSDEVLLEGVPHRSDENTLAIGDWISRRAAAASAAPSLLAGRCNSLALIIRRRHFGRRVGAPERGG